MIIDPCQPAVFVALETLIPGDTDKLVKGNEQILFERLMPMVREQSIVLDLSRVERIDAAGLTALIKLYCAARNAGHDFSVFNPSARVAEILALVRLDGLLVAKRGEQFSCHSLHFQESAA